MLFDHFRGHFAIWLRKSSFSTCFIRVSATRFWRLRNLVFVGFIRFSDMAECHVGFIYKRNAFSIIFEAILRFWLQKSSFSTGFIRYFHRLFRVLQNVVLLMVSKVFWGPVQVVMPNRAPQNEGFISSFPWRVHSFISSFLHLSMKDLFYEGFIYEGFIFWWRNEGFIQKS